MSEPNTRDAAGDSGGLTPEIEQVCDRFEAAWKAGGEPRIEDCLGVASPDDVVAEQRDLLFELVLIDLEYRWRRTAQRRDIARETEPGGLPRRPTLADYVARFPVLGALSALPDEAFSVEYRARRIWGDQPGIREYLDQIGPSRPELAEELRQIDESLDARGLEGESQPRVAASAPNVAAVVGQQSEVDTPRASALSGPTQAAGSDAAATEPTPKRLGRYRIDSLLGKGGMAQVYLAWDERLQRRVAIKMPRADLFPSVEGARLFVEEARTVAALNHPGIVAVYDAGRADDQRPFVVMEYVEGESLLDRLQREKATLRWAVTTVATVADAVAYAHQHGFVHRDLKPANVLIDSRGSPHVVDFGLAFHEKAQWDRAGEYAGTLAYMSPELVRGEVHLSDGRTDIWALGVLLYETLTGRRPFDGCTREQLAEEILRREPKPLRQIDDTIPQRLEAICLKCLSKPIAGRYAIASDLANALRQFVEQTEAASQPVPPPDVKQTRRTLRPVGNLGRLGYGLCLLVVLVAAPYVAHLYLNRDEPHVRNVDTPRSAKIAAIDPKQAAPDLVGGASQEDTAEQEAGGQRPAVDAEPETPRAGTGAEPETRRPRAEAKPETQPPAAEADARKSATSTVPRAGPSDDSGTPPESWLKQAERLAATEAAPEHRAAAWVALARAHHSLGDTAGCDEALQAAAEATKAVTDPYVGCRAMMSVVSAYERLGRFGESETLVSLLMARLEAMPSVAKGRPVPESYAPGEFKMMLLGQLAGIYSQAAARAPADSDLGQASTTLLARMEQVAAGLGTEGERYLGRLYRVAALVEQGRYGEALAEARPRDKPYSADHFMDGEYYGSLVEAMLAQGAVKAGDHLEYEKHRLAAEGMLAMAKGRSAEVRDRAQLALIEAATAAGETEQAQDKVGELRGPASRAHALLTVGTALAGAGQIDPAGEMLSEIHRDPRAEALAYELGRARRRAGEDPDGLNTWLQTLPPGAVRAAAMAGAAAAPRDHARQASEGNHG